MKNIAFIVILVSIVLFGCTRTEKIDDFPLEKPKLVLNCFIKNNKPFEFFLSKSLSSIDNAPIKKVSNAEIKIYEDDVLVEVINKETTNPRYTLDAYYVSNFMPQIGKRYKITASAPNLGTVNSESTLPKELENVKGTLGKMDTVIYTYSSNNIEDSAKYVVTIMNGSITLNIPDQINVNNYYKINLKVEEKFWNGTSWDYRWRTIQLKNGETDYENYSNGLFLSDKIYDGKVIPVKLDIDYGYMQTADPKLRFKIIVTSQSEQKQKYDISLGQYYQNQDNPFVEPTLVYSNIVNGYGIFASESEFELILE